MTQKKQKALDNINYRMRGDNTLAMIEVLTPIVEKVKKAYVWIDVGCNRQKKILKEDDIPKDVKEELTTVLYLVDMLNITNWNKLKKQLLFKYGEDWMEKVMETRKHVNEKILEFVDYKVIDWMKLYGVAKGEDCT